MLQRNPAYQAGAFPKNGLVKVHETGKDSWIYIQPASIKPSYSRRQPSDCWNLGFVDWGSLGLSPELPSSPPWSGSLSCLLSQQRLKPGSCMAPFSLRCWSTEKCVTFDQKHTRTAPAQSKHTGFSSAIPAVTSETFTVSQPWLWRWLWKPYSHWPLNKPGWLDCFHFAANLFSLIYWFKRDSPFNCRCSVTVVFHKTSGISSATQSRPWYHR
jgi:hypothetical protein